MEQHLLEVAKSSASSFKIRCAAERGLAKLRKYSIPAKLHHSYIVGTSKLLQLLDHKVSLTVLLVLHPCLRSQWFATTADAKTPVAEDEAIKTAEVVFRYIAEAYLQEMSTSNATAIPSAAPPAAKPLMKTSSFLASACAFQRQAMMSTTIISKRTSLEELTDELDRYFGFESAPVAKQEGDEENGEPSDEEVLLNPLLWWKVSTMYPICNVVPQFTLLDPCNSIPNHCPDGTGLSCHSSNKCLCRTRFFEVTPYLQYITKLIEGRHYQDGTTHEGVDPRWPL